MRRFVQDLADPGDGWPGDVGAALAALPARYNLSKGSHAGVIVLHEGHWRVGPMVWGLVPSWEKGPSTRYSTQTARLERAPRSRLFRRAWTERRCVVPMSGYYKWDRDTPRRPHFIQATGGEVLVAAGLWSTWHAPDAPEQVLLSFAVLTRPNEAIPTPLTPDGPCFLPVASIAEWLQGGARGGQSLLLRAPQPKLERWRVSRRVVDRSLDDYTLLEPAAASDDFDRILAPPGEPDPDFADEDDEY